MPKLNRPKPKSYVDYRKLLEDQSIHAVSIATPNHWHSLMGIWACQAGKDVHIEKPLPHNWWDTSNLAAAANKYNRIVRHGTQCRWGAKFREAFQRIQDDLLGDVCQLSP